MCLTTAPIAQRLLMRGARLAAALVAPLLVLTVLDSHRLRGSFKICFDGALIQKRVFVAISVKFFCLAITA